MRSASNTNTNPLITRYPVDYLVAALDAHADGEGTTFLPPFGTMPRSTFSKDYLRNSSAGYSIHYPAANFRRCLDAKK